MSVRGTVVVPGVVVAALALASPALAGPHGFACIINNSVADVAIGVTQLQVEVTDAGQSPDGRHRG